MKNILLLGLVGSLFSCQPKVENTSNELQNQIDNLKRELSETYKPGFGEFMSAIQIHHAKLWFAGTNENWKLAEFEMNEIRENLEAIQKYCSDRVESKSIGMINLPMESLNNSILKKNKEMFQRDFKNLTVSCNTCHQATHHEYNVIVIPQRPPFTNQDFQIKK